MSGALAPGWGWPGDGGASARATATTRPAIAARRTFMPSFIMSPFPQPATTRVCRSCPARSSQRCEIYGWALAAGRAGVEWSAMPRIVLNDGPTPGAVEPGPAAERLQTAMLAAFGAHTDDRGRVRYTRLAASEHFAEAERAARALGGAPV